MGEVIMLNRAGFIDYCHQELTSIINSCCHDLLILMELVVIDDDWLDY